MKISRLGIFVLVLFSVVLGASCNFYNRVMARKSLVDGATSFKERNYAEAEEKFRSAIEYDPELSSFESKTAQLFLARTIHSEFASNRQLRDKASQAIEEYKKSLDSFVNDYQEKKTAAQNNAGDEKAQREFENSKDTIGSIVRAVASLYENLQQEDQWREWQIKQASNEQLPEDVRANAYVALAARQYTCANDISDVEPVKKTVIKDDEPIFEFTKPENEEDYSKLQTCVKQGTEYIDKAIALNGNSDSAWSYKTSLLMQDSRIAQMNEETEREESLKKKADEAKAKFQELAEARRKREEQEEARRKAEAEAKKKRK